MKNKLYAFLGKRKTFINVFGIAAWLCFIFNLQTNKPVAIAGAVFMCVYICVADAKALQSFMDERNSSSPHWDGHTTPQRSKRENPAHIVMAKTARIEFRTDEVFIKSLEDLAKRTNRNRAEVIRDAMNLYIRAVDEWDKGRGVTFAPMAKVQLNTKTEETYLAVAVAERVEQGKERVFTLEESLADLGL